jgi:Helix-turn-helix domain/Domain of unknown function (DUF4115)
VGAFGDKFRTERERRGFTLDDVSNVTKINSRMLKAIEEEHFDRLPGGVFNKGFVRAYAKHLGFNDEESVSEYLAALRQAQVQAQTAVWQGDASSQGRTEPSRPERTTSAQLRTERVQSEAPRTEKIRVDLKPNPPAVKVPSRTVPDEVTRTVKPEVKAGINQDLKPEIRQAAVPVQKAREIMPAQAVPGAEKNLPGQISAGSGAFRRNSIPWKVPAAALVVILVVAALWNRHSHGVQAESGGGAGVRNAATSSSASNAVPSASPQPAASHETGNSAGSAAPAHEAKVVSDRSADHSVTDRAAANSDVSDRDIRTRKSHNAPAAAKPLPVFTLRIRASQTTWIAVTADGQPETHETLIAPASTYIRATREISVRVGNASGISFLFNGKEIPPQSSEPQIRTFTFDSTGMRAAPGQTAEQDR